MDKSIVLLGDPSIVRPLLTDYVYVEKEDVFLLFTDRTNKDFLLQKFQSSGVTAYTYEQYMAVLRKTCTYEPITSLDGVPAYDWLGSEYFGLLASGRFSLYKVGKKDAEEVTKIDDAQQVLISNTGVFFAISQHKKVNVRFGASFNNFLTIKRPGVVKSVSFDPQDKYIAVCTQDSAVVYDLARGHKVLEEIGNEVLFSERGAYVRGCNSEIFFPLINGKISDDMAHRVDKLSLENTKKEFCTKRLFSEDGKRSVEFLDGTPQKIVYSENGKTYTKTQANIHDIDFYFSKNRIYAVIAKKTSSTLSTPSVPVSPSFGSFSSQRQNFSAASFGTNIPVPSTPAPSYTYTVESYSGADIRSTTLPAKPISFSCSDFSFVVFDSSNNLRFYKKDKYGFQLLESQKKMGSGIVSMADDDVVCFYDSASSVVEFYDAFRLRAVHPQQGCTAMSW